MSIIRVNKNSNYTVMSNFHLRDKRLSLKAKGLLSYMLSCRDDWDFSVTGLRAVLKEGKDAITAALHELEETGYLIRSRDERQVGKSNRYIYDVYEEPQTISSQVPVDNSVRRPENPSSGNPTSETPPQRSTNDIRNTEKEETLISKNPSTGNSNRIAPPEKVINADAIKEDIRKQIEYEEHIDRYHQDFVDCLVGLITEMKVFALRDDSIRSGEAVYPPDLVLDKLSKIRWDHIQYIMECMQHRSDPEPIRNIKAYLQKSILNAPDTIDAWYMAEVQFDRRHR